MFEGLKTWNPWFGCYYRCYKDGCWAKRRLSHRLGKMLKCDLCYDFKPHFHKERLENIPSDFGIFVVAHGDFFAPWVPFSAIQSVLFECRKVPKEVWFYESKNPARFFDFISMDGPGMFPENTVLSTTIETNKDFGKAIMGMAPPTTERLRYIYDIGLYSKLPVHISIEPIMDFDLNVLLRWMKIVKPFKVSVGYDSLNNNLPEPSKEKTLELIEELETFTDVERKQL